MRSYIFYIFYSGSRQNTRFLKNGFSTQKQNRRVKVKQNMNSEYEQI